MVHSYTPIKKTSSYYQSYSMSSFCLDCTEYELGKLKSLTRAVQRRLDALEGQHAQKSMCPGPWCKFNGQQKKQYKIGLEHSQC